MLLMPDRPELKVFGELAQYGEINSLRMVRQHLPTTLSDCVLAPCWTVCQASLAHVSQGPRNAVRECGLFPARQQDLLLFIADPQLLSDSRPDLRQGMRFARR